MKALEGIRMIEDRVARKTMQKPSAEDMTELTE